jgi:TIR domain
MSDQPRVFLSHTTGDQRDFHLAHNLAKALQARGAKVWIAPDSIPAGSQWEPQIVSGILQQCTHFLVIVSAASIGSEWVLKEVNLARERHQSNSDLTILPLVVGQVGAYPSSDFLNQFQRIPYHNDFATQLEEVAAALGLRPVVPNQFQALINERTEGFVGRDYVFAAIDDFISNQPNGYVVIEGDPGVGKSTILAQYVRQTGCIAHFNVLSQGINRANQFLEGVCTQIIARYGLPYFSLPPNATQDGAFLGRLLDEVAAQLGSDEKLVIAIDALDEVNVTGHPPGANILFLPSSLPVKVFFVMTRRHVALPFVSHAPRYLLDLTDYFDESLRDVRTYIRRAAGREKLSAWIERHGLKAADFVTILAEKSENNFMYLRYVLPEIERGVYEDLNIENLPSGLGGYYEDHWRRMGMTAKPLPRTKIKIVYILSEVRQPVSRSLIADFAGEDELTVQEVLDEWGQFLRGQNVDGQTRYSVYHTSFRDFLHRQDVVKIAGVSLKEINALIADNLYEQLFGDE